GPEAVHVLDLHLRAEGGRPGRAERDVGVAAEVPVLHVRFADADVAQDLAEADQVVASFGGRSHVRLAHNLHERRARAVDVDQAVAFAGNGVGAVEEAGGVLFHVDAGDADAAAFGAL